jgi:3-oxoacyl-[acyl-carrier protein] reductase
MTAGGQTAEMFQAPADGSFHMFDPANVAPLVGYLSSSDAAKISGEVLVVWGNEVQILKRPTLGGAIVNPKGAKKWELQDLHTSLAEHYDENYVSVWGGYSVPPV